LSCPQPPSNAISSGAIAHVVRGKRTIVTSPASRRKDPVVADLHRRRDGEGPAFDSKPAGNLQALLLLDNTVVAQLLDVAGVDARSRQHLVILQAHGAA
jgi:hypothetical protein